MSNENSHSSENVSKSVDLLLTHGRVITMDSQRRILRDGAIAVDNGRIVAIGPSQEVSRSVRGVEERDLNGSLVHPGFIDAHVHPTTMRPLCTKSTRAHQLQKRLRMRSTTPRFWRAWKWRITARQPLQIRVASTIWTDVSAQ